MTKTDPFASYKLPLGLTEGVLIPLPGTPAVFRVRLPGNMNEEFNMRLMSRLNLEPDEEGRSRVNAGEFQRIRREMFFDECVLSSEGTPDGMTHAEFFAAYPLAARALYDHATALSIKADEEANVSLGKFETLLNGSGSGKGAQINTTKLSNRASSPKQHAPN